MVQEILAFFKIPWIAAFTAVFFWWFLTGLILFIVKKVDEINQRAHKFVTLILCPVFFLGVYLYLTSLSNISLSSIYSAFFGSLLIWVPRPLPKSVIPSKSISFSNNHLASYSLNPF